MATIQEIYDNAIIAYNQVFEDAGVEPTPIDEEFVQAAISVYQVKGERSPFIGWVKSRRIAVRALRVLIRSIKDQVTPE